MDQSQDKVIEQIKRSEKAIVHYITFVFLALLLVNAINNFFSQKDWLVAGINIVIMAILAITSFIFYIKASFSK